MIQAAIGRSTGVTEASRGNSDKDTAASAGQSGQLSRQATRCSIGTANILLQSALEDVERRAQNIASVLWLMAHSTKVDEIAGEAMLSIEDMVRELRDVATGARQIEVVS